MIQLWGGHPPNDPLGNEGSVSWDGGCSRGCPSVILASAHAAGTGAASLPPVEIRIVCSGISCMRRDRLDMRGAPELLTPKHTQALIGSDKAGT